MPPNPNSDTINSVFPNRIFLIVSPKRVVLKNSEKILPHFYAHSKHFLN
jgi:hypothetical protein